jgi:hypothetical protein
MRRYPLNLTGATEKLDRAAEHVRSLVGEVDAFQNDNPLTTFAEFEAGHDFLVKVRVPRTPDLRWGVMLGDTVHNLRSALDHAAWELVQRNVRAGFKPALTQRQERSIQYPIADDRAKFNDAAIMCFLTTRQTALLRKYQPYRRPWPEATPLSELAWLDNIDKHRIIHPAHIALGAWELVRFRIQSNLSAGQCILAEPLIGADDRLVDGAAIARLTFEMPSAAGAATAAAPHIQVDGEFASEIRFGEGRPIPKYHLDTLHELIFNIIRLLKLRIG